MFDNNLNIVPAYCPEQFHRMVRGIRVCLKNVRWKNYGPTVVFSGRRRTDGQQETLRANLITDVEQVWQVTRDTSYKNSGDPLPEHWGRLPERVKGLAESIVSCKRDKERLEVDVSRLGEALAGTVYAVNCLRATPQETPIWANLESARELLIEQVDQAEEALQIVESQLEDYYDLWQERMHREIHEVGKW